VHLLLTTDATVVNRRPLLQVDDGVAGNYVRSPAPATIGASNNLRTIWCVDATFAASPLVNDVLAFLPPTLTLKSGSRILTNSVGLQAGDNYSAPTLLLREWLEVQS
jgi:hypothetical protein